MNFSIEEIMTAGVMRYHVRGYVNESAQFPALLVAPLVRINLGEVKGLNSVGTRSWCNWVKQVTSPRKIELERCPALFVKSFNTVTGMLTENMEVVSFYVPFLTPSDGQRVDVLVRMDQISLQGELLLKNIQDEKGETLECDVLADYFRFTKR